MTKKTAPSPAEQSRQAAKAALARKAAEKKREEEDLQKQIIKMNEELESEEEERKIRAVPIGEKLYALLREKIKEEEGEGRQKLQRSCVSLLVGLTYKGEGRLARHAFNNAAKKLRDDEYKVRFNNNGVSGCSTDPYGGWSFYNLSIEVYWGEEEEKR